MEQVCANCAGGVFRFVFRFVESVIMRVARGVQGALFVDSVVIRV